MRQGFASVPPEGLAPPGRHLRALPDARLAFAGPEIVTRSRVGQRRSHIGWVERPEMIERLATSEARLILLEAPPGYGKTVLAAQWCASMPVNWAPAGISLGEDDNEPRTLWRHIARALLSACPDVDAEPVFRHLRATSPDITGAVIPHLVNQLAARAGPAVLLLDDYQWVSEPRCHEQVTFLLDHLPSSAQVVLVTRVAPPLPLARWRAHGEVAEFRADDLRFTKDEAAQLIRTVSGLQLSEADLAGLVERAEGWPTGLYLVARSLSSHRSPSAFARRFAKARPAIANFMADEVLGRQPASIRRFLARTSILAEFCAPLCDEVTGSRNAAEILAVLERENVFVVPLDQSRQWFRYNHLFAQALRRELEQTEPDIVTALHQRASRWYLRSGSVSTAIRHAIAADDRASAIDLIAAHWFDPSAPGRAATVSGWVHLLGETTIGTDPVAAHCAAWSAAMSGDREAVRRWLPVIAGSTRAGPLPDGMHSLESSAALLEGFCGFGGLESMVLSAGRSVELESDPSSPWFGIARAALGLGRYLSGDPAAAQGPLLEGVAADMLLPRVRLLSLSVLSLTAAELGQLERAQQWADQAFAFMADGRLNHTPAASLAFAATGAAHAALGRPLDARRALEQALRLRHRVPGISVWPTVDILLRLATVLVDIAERSSAAALAEEAGLLLAASPGEACALHARLDQLGQRLDRGPSSVLLADPLTEREATVLHLLGSDVPLHEIAIGLNRSVNTVKTQVRSIYCKLGVSARWDAVRRARELGLL